MVGRGKGMMGTPGARGGWVGAGWGAGCAITAGAWLGAWLPEGAALGAGRVTGAALAVAEGAFLGASAVFGRAALAVGFALTFEVVVCPFDFERPSELSGALLPIRRCRSILLTQV